MNARRFVAVAGFLLQLVPLAVIATTIFIASKPPELSTQPSVAAGGAFVWWVFPYSIGLGLTGIAAIWSRTAAIVAVLLTAFAIAFGLSFVRGPGGMIVVAAVVSILGWILRVAVDRLSPRVATD